MLKIPKGYKFKKAQKGRLKNIVSKNLTLKDLVSSGMIALKSASSGLLTPNHINCCKQLLNKTLKKTSQIQFLAFPHRPVTKKPLEIRMGKGKGNVDRWVSNIFSGNGLLEIEGNNVNAAKKAVKAIKYKLPVKTYVLYDL